MSKRILVVGSKGGSARTTTSVLLANALAKIGDQQVGVIDLDPQKSAHNWLESYPIDGVDRISTSKQGQGKDFIIIDTQPLVSPSKRMIEEAKSADFILLLCSDSPLDIHATSLTVRNLLTTKALKKKSHLLFSRVVKGTGLSKLLDQMTDAIGIQRLKQVIHFKNCFREAPIKGWRALNTQARDEIKSLLAEILIKLK